MSNSENQLLDDIHEVNLSYLILAQRLLKENKNVGMYRLGISEDVAETRSEEHMSELQSRGHLVCRLLLEKKKMDLTPLREGKAVDSYSFLDRTKEVSDEIKEGVARRFGMYVIYCATGASEGDAERDVGTL